MQCSVLTEMAAANSECDSCQRSCEGQKQVGIIRPSPSTQQEGEKCQRCCKAYPQKSIPNGNHVCKICEIVYDAREWSTRMLCLHSNGMSYKKLICSTCEMKADTSKKTEKYTCHRCKKQQSGMHFDAVQMKNFKARQKKEKGKKPRLICRTCSVRCVVCETSDADAKKAGKRKTEVLCHACRKLGYTVRDTVQYQCSDCHETGGRKKFETVSMNNYRANKTSRLHCITCHKRIREKTQTLKEKMKTSKIQCKCRLSNHAPKCPMFSRWGKVHKIPGEDVLTADEIKFLNERLVAPDWWHKAWGGIRKQQRCTYSAGSHNTTRL